MMTTPHESEGCSGGDDISRSKTQSHCEQREQGASAPQTKVSTECKQTANSDEKRENRNHSFTSTASPSLLASADPQKSPRIGVAPPRPAPAARRLTDEETAAVQQSLASLQSQQSLLGHIGELDDLVAVAISLAKLEQPLYGRNFDRKSGHYIQRAVGAFPHRGRNWCWCILEVALSKYLLIVSDFQHVPVVAVPMHLSWESAIAPAQS